MNEAFSTITPKCCGQPMKTVFETPRFLELACEVCGDIVYFKKHMALAPRF